jgi:hypothetical protein
VSRKGFLAFCIAVTCVILIGLATVGILTCYEWISSHYTMIAVSIACLFVLAGFMDLFYQLVLIEEKSQKFKKSFFATINYDRTLIFNRTMTFLTILFLGIGINTSYKYINKQLDCFYEAKGSVEKANALVAAANKRVDQITTLNEDLTRRVNELVADNKALYKTAKSKLSAGGPKNF